LNRHKAYLAKLTDQVKTQKQIDDAIKKEEEEWEKKFKENASKQRKKI